MKRILSIYKMLNKYINRMENQNQDGKNNIILVCKGESK